MNDVRIAQPPVTMDPARLAKSRLANAYSLGDPRYQMKQLDRAGFSRGGAQRNQAGINAAQQMSDSIAEVYSGQLQDQQARALANLQSQQGQEQFAQSLGSLQQQNNYANQMAALQRQGAMMNLLGGLLR